MKSKLVLFVLIGMGLLCVGCKIKEPPHTDALSISPAAIPTIDQEDVVTNPPEVNQEIYDHLENRVTVNKEVSKNLSEVYQSMKEQGLTSISIDEVDQNAYFERVWNCFDSEYWYELSYIKSIDDREAIIKEFTKLVLSSFEDEEDNAGKKYIISEQNCAPSDYYEFIHSIRIPDSKQTMFELYGAPAYSDQPDELCYVVDFTNPKNVIVTNRYGTNYANIGNEINDYINKQKLVGTYRDEKNEIYQFNTDRQAQWKDENFYYETFNDYLDTGDSNAIFRKESPDSRDRIYYVYRIVEDKIHLYLMKPDENVNYVMEAQPFAILTRVEEK